MAKLNEIRDDEFRVIGPRRGAKSSSTRESGSRGWWMALVSVVLVLMAGLAIWLFRPKGEIPPKGDGLFDPVPSPAATRPSPKPLGRSVDSLTAPFAEKLDTTINDVVLSVYIPHNTQPPVLTVGVPDQQVRKAVLAFQAADIRADNREILGSFVLKGDLLARGKSKDGFCAIIDGTVTVGVEENSSLFEEAVEKGGYFFRQYSLVRNGVLEESEIKNKTMRKALCDRAGQIFVAVSETDESMHDFAQALVDLGVDNAIYLVGSHSSFGWYRDESGAQTYFCADVHRKSYRNENYIVWY